LLHALRTPLDEEQKAELGGTRPFFLIVILVLGSFAIWLLMSAPALQQPVRRFSFIFLMVVYLAMQWFLQRLTFIPNLILPLILLQSLLAVFLVLISGNDALVMALILPLIGEIIGFFRSRMLFSVLGVLALLAIAIALLVYLGTWNMGSFWLTALPLIAFVITFVTLFMREAEARQAAQESARELREANRRVIEYASRVEDLTRAAERERLARELHDTLSQGLSGLVLQLDAAHAHLENENMEKAEEILVEAIDRGRDALAESRLAISDLRASDSEQEDLESLILREVTRFTMTTGIPCDFEFNIPEELPPPAPDHLLRIATEGLNNIARHAKAQHARVIFSEKDGPIAVTITDDGLGFDPAGDPTASGHYGLVGMRERARLLGASFEIESAPGGGTTIRLVIPMEAA